MRVELTARSFDELLDSSDEPVFIDFWASWCIPCKSVERILKKLEPEYKGRIVIAKINVDRNPSIGNRYNIAGIPTFIIFKNGEPLDRGVGAMSECQIRRMIEEHV
jgi:thioredoxin 1